MTTRRSAMALLLAGMLTVPVVLSAQADERDARFEEMMSGTRMEGKFSVVGQAGAALPDQDDLYMISEIERGEGSTWIFKAAMSYGAENTGGEPPRLEIPVTVEWAGDTPVLTMTEQTVEGFGTFTVRLPFFGDRYAGTWQNGPIGGHMWGQLVPADEGVD